MNAIPPAPGLPSPLSADRVRVIRRSMRCFVFGLLGAVPLFGMGMACLALLLQRRIGEESGEPVRLTGANKCSLTAFGMAVVLLCCDDSGLVLALGILLSALPGFLLFRQYQRAEPSEWNPARHLIYWGAGLAYAGLVLSSTIILLNLDSALRKLGG